MIDYEKEAKKFESQASAVSRLSKTTKKYTPKNASNLYQEAAKNWLKYVASSKDISDKNKKKGLFSALQNLTYAMRLAPHRVDRDDISKMKNKISSKLEEFSRTKSIKPNAKLGVFSQIFPAILSMISLVFALVFTSISLTGYSVLGLMKNNSRFVGVIFFVVGLVFALVYFKTKNGKRINGKKKR